MVQSKGISIFKKIEAWKHCQNSGELKEVE